jgi:UDP-N-acetylglucosamine transferase subunit ALG13
MLQTEPKKIFISVGSRFSMYRLLESVEDMMVNNPHLEAKAQTGPIAFKSRQIQTAQWADAAEFDRSVYDCDIFISHAGMGNILLAAKYQKPIIIMPRRSDLGEHINDHQLSTAMALKGRPFISVVNDSQELEQAVLDILQGSVNNPDQHEFNNESRVNLIIALKNFIDYDKL